MNHVLAGRPVTHSLRTEPRFGEAFVVNRRLGTLASYQYLRPARSIRELTATHEEVAMFGCFRIAAVLALVAVVSSGCAINRATASLDPSADIEALKTMYVKKQAADNGGTNVLIADKLRTKGVAVTTGAEPPPSNVDAVVTYVDRWMWDITMYMLELTITIREPKTDFPLATGNSLYTSLTRLSPKEMVSEVIDNIYKAEKRCSVYYHSAGRAGGHNSQSGRDKPAISVRRSGRGERRSRCSSLWVAIRDFRCGTQVRDRRGDR
jgi:hypothetical protein